MGLYKRLVKSPAPQEMLARSGRSGKTPRSSYTESRLNTAADLLSTRDGGSAAASPLPAAVLNNVTSVLSKRDTRESAAFRNYFNL